MTDLQIIERLEGIEARLEALHREVITIRESVAPDLAPIIAMHQGKHTATEASSNPKKGGGHERI